MSAVSPDIAERARKNFSAVLNAFKREGQVHVAARIGIHESTLSKLISGDLEKVCSALAAAGLKTVPIEYKCYRAEDIEPYIQLARQHMARLKSAEDLLFEDPE